MKEEAEGMEGGGRREVGNRMLNFRCKYLIKYNWGVDESKGDSEIVIAERRD